MREPKNRSAFENLVQMCEMSAISRECRYFRTRVRFFGSRIAQKCRDSNHIPQDLRQAPGPQIDAVCLRFGHKNILQHRSAQNITTFGQVSFLRLSRASHPPDPAPGTENPSGISAKRTVSRRAHRHASGLTHGLVASDRARAQHARAQGRSGQDQ